MSLLAQGERRVQGGKGLEREAQTSHRRATGARRYVAVMGGVQSHCKDVYELKAPSETEHFNRLTVLINCTGSKGGSLENTSFTR